MSSRNHPFDLRYRWGHRTFDLGSEEGPDDDHTGLGEPTAFSSEGSEGDGCDGSMDDEYVIKLVERCCGSSPR
jgi:hypothetical protein